MVKGAYKFSFDGTTLDMSQLDSERYPTEGGVVTALILVTANFMVDILCGVIDPRLLLKKGMN